MFLIANQWKIFDMAFLNQYEIGPTAQRGRIQLLAPLRYVDRQGRCWEVPEGFESDGASIPAYLWHIIGHPLGDYLSAAILHDYLYREQVVDREDSDRIFLDAMQDLGIERWRRSVMWAAVRLFGKWSWNQSIWLVMVFIIALAFLSGCVSTRYEERSGREYKIEETKLLGVTLATSEERVTNKLEAEIREQKERLRQKGILWIRIAALCAALAVAGHIGASYIGRSPVLHRVSEWALAGSAGAACAGLMLCAMAAWWQWIILAAGAAVVCTGLYFLLKYKRAGDDQ